MFAMALGSYKKEMKGTKVQTLGVTIDTQSIYGVTHFSTN